MSSSAVTVRTHPTGGTSTLVVPVTSYTAAHPQLFAALLAYPFATQYPFVPEALYSALQTLSLGEPLGPEAEAAVSSLLGLSGGWPDFCPSCYVPVRDGNEWDEDWEAELDSVTGLYTDPVSGTGFRWTAGSGAGGFSSCNECGGLAALASPTRGGSGWGRPMVHPSQWLAEGLRPERP